MFLTKKLVLALLAVGVAVCLTACSKNDCVSSGPVSPPLVNDDEYHKQRPIEVSTSIYDDNKSSVYIKVDKLSSTTDMVITELMTKKQKWEEKNPKKRVIAMTVVNNLRIGTFDNYPVIGGLLIHYE